MNSYVEMGDYKYALFTDKIFQSIFQENIAEYKQILKLESEDVARDTMYSEILNLIASFEVGIAYELKVKFEELGRKLYVNEVDELFEKFANHPQQKPHIEDARVKMASRDLHFREAFHKKLEDYIQSIPSSDFERYLGEQSVNFEEQLEKAKDVFKRLKDAD